MTWEGCTEAGRLPQSQPCGEVPLPSDKTPDLWEIRLTLQEQLVNEAETDVQQPGAELAQGLWQLEEAMLLTVGAHQGFQAGRVVLQVGELLLCIERRLVPY